MDCAIVVPAYKKADSLLISEVMSLENTGKMFANRDIFLLCPESFSNKSVDAYEKIATHKIKALKMPDEYFTSTKQYSQMLLKDSVYNALVAKYEYMLVCQTDCWTLSDDLDTWCEKQYDYVGAPIFSPNALWVDHSHRHNGYMPQVGNGGYSIRKIETFIDMTRDGSDLKEFINGNTSDVEYEDKWFCNDIEMHYDLVRPSWREAMHFAIDMNPEIAYKVCGEDTSWLPMGMHAWPKNIRFWKDKIKEIASREDVVDECEDRYKEFFKLYYSQT